MREHCGLKCCLTVKQISIYTRSVSLSNFSIEYLIKILKSWALYKIILRV